MPLRKLISSPLLWLALALLATAALYWPGLSGGFFFDDEVNIVRNPAILAKTLAWPDLAPALHAGVASPMGRPLALLSFAANHAVSGLHPFPFKLTNLILHLANGLLVYGLTASLVRQKAGGAALSPAFPLWVASAWLLLPINLSTVLFVTQRMNGLATFFMLAATLGYLLGRENAGWRRLLAWTTAVGVLWPAAFLSKEIALTWPLLVALLEFCFWRKEAGNAAARRLAAVGLALCLAAGIAVLLYLALGNSGWFASGYRMRDFSWQERLLTESRVLWVYLRLMLFPQISEFGLYHDDFGLSRSWLSPATTALAIGGWVSAIALAWRLRRRLPWFAGGIAWFLVGHLIESTLLPLELVHEHRNYLPSLGIIWALGSLILPSAQASGGVADRFRPGAYVLALAFLALSGLVTGMRSDAYGRDIMRAVIEAEYHPTSARSNYEAALTLVRYAGARGDPIDPLTAMRAGSYYQKSLDAAPNFKLGFLGLMHLACYQGQPVQPGWVSGLAQRLEQTPLSLADRTLLHDLVGMTRQGTLCLPGSDLEHLLSAAFGNPAFGRDAEISLRLDLSDLALFKLQEMSLARRQADTALKLAPERPASRLQLARVLLFTGETGALKQELDRLAHYPMDANQAKELNVLRQGLSAQEKSK